MTLVAYLLVAGAHVAASLMSLLAIIGVVVIGIYVWAYINAVADSGD